MMNIPFASSMQHDVVPQSGGATGGSSQTPTGSGGGTLSSPGGSGGSGLQGRG
jgi:hypothetical protein